MGKKLIIIVMLLVTSVAGAWAEGYTVETVPNVQLSDRHNFVSNPDRLLSPTATDSINSMLNRLRDQGLAEVAVVVVDKVSADEDTYFFAHNLLNRWGVGVEGQDNGLVLFASLGLRQIQIEVGYGLEGKMTDALCKRVIDRVIAPHLSAGDWDGGITAGVAAIYGTLTENPQYFATGRSEEIPAHIPFIIMCCVLALFTAVRYAAERLRNRCPRCKRHGVMYTAHSRIVSDTLMSRTIETTRRCRHCGHTTFEMSTINKAHIVGGFGPRGGGGFGGFGGGGFGGGMSGGGGARGGF